MHYNSLFLLQPFALSVWAGSVEYVTHPVRGLNQHSSLVFSSSPLFPWFVQAKHSVLTTCSSWILSLLIGNHVNYQAVVMHPLEIVMQAVVKKLVHQGAHAL
jgi:hypothetical protein